MDKDAKQCVIEAKSLYGSNVNASHLVNKVRKLLFWQMLVGIKDGRFFSGTFHCIDKQGNIILQDAKEHCSSRGTPNLPWKRGSLVLIQFQPRVELLVMWIAPLMNIGL